MFGKSLICRATQLLESPESDERCRTWVVSTGRVQRDEDKPHHSNIPPAEAEEQYCAMLDAPPWPHNLTEMASSKPRGGSPQ